MIKAQSAIEFIILTSFMFFVILGFFAVTSSKVSEVQEESGLRIAEDIARLAYNEIEIAKSVNDGYTRLFVMPDTVNGVSYEIAIIDDRELVVKYFDYEYVMFLPANMSGSISKGNNFISKANGVVFINSGAPE